MFRLLVLALVTIVIIIGYTVEPKPVLSHGEALYQQHCAACHHPRRIGQLAPPLLPEFLKRKSPELLKNVIRRGIPASQMPGFSHLSDAEIEEIIDYVQSPAQVDWQKQNIMESHQQLAFTPQNLPIGDAHELTVVVERGDNQVWLMEREKVLDRFAFANVHGGVKFSPDARAFFIPGRDGWIGRYAVNAGRLTHKVRSCIYLRNIALTRDGKYLLAAAGLPSALVVLRAKDLQVVKILPVTGKISAIYELQQQDRAIFTFRDRPVVGWFDTKTLEVEFFAVSDPWEDFFIDPLESFAISSCRRGQVLQVWDLRQRRQVFEHALPGMPHLFSATFWYHDNHFYFATPHIRGGQITIWRMYDWAFVNQIPTGGNGFFIRTHSATSELWADNGSDELLLINKRDFAIRKLRPMPGKKVLHTEFSADGSLAYVSIYEKQGALVIYDTATLRKVRTLKANTPVGKYNFRQKSRQYLLPQLGEQVFMNKCWGCHHPTEKAFAPSFRWIIDHRSESWIRAQILSPKSTAEHLGYQRSVMPQLAISDAEMQALLSFMREQKQED